VPLLLLPAKITDNIDKGFVRQLYSQACQFVKQPVPEKKQKKIPGVINGEIFSTVVWLYSQPFAALGHPAQASPGALVAAGQLGSLAPALLYPC
jgi:hypothetical protein